MKTVPQEAEILRRQIERSWTEQLYKEYRNILYQYGLSLHLPLIVVMPLKAIWGSWNAASRTLTINSSLIENFSWDIVVEILKHEMAHQYVSERLGPATDETPHGPKFKAACALLGCSEWSKAATGALPSEIPQWKDKTLSPEDERLLKRAEKLLALAASSNENEAILAMQRVRELYARHNLARLSQQNLQEDVYLVIDPKKKRMEMFEGSILGILNKHFFVYCIYTTLYDAKDQRSYKVIEVLGSRENVLMAEYVYQFLHKSVLSLWQAHKKEFKKGQKLRRAFLLGVMHGFSEKMANYNANINSNVNGSSNSDGESSAQESSAQETSGTGLSTLETSALLEKTTAMIRNGIVKRRHPKLVFRSTGSGHLDQGTYDAGKEEGKRLTISRPISSASGPKGLLLAAKGD